MTRVCPECFDNSIVKRRVDELRRNRELPPCTFHPRRKGVPVAELAGLMDPVLRANYSIVHDAYLSGGQSFHDLLFDLTGADDERVVQALGSALIDGDVYDARDGDMPFYGDDQDYERLEPDGWLQSQLWTKFRYAILHGRRFFNLDAQRLLDEIFDKVHLLSDDKGRPALYPLDTNQIIHRARRVRTLDEAGAIGADAAAKLGAPPEPLRRAGRMNATGIGAFYAALDEATCIAELRPPVGGLVCVGGFRASRPVHVLDLTRFERPGRQIDIFAKNYAARTTQWAFMQSFQVEISKPVLPDDEHLEYVPAQAVAEYLTSLTVTVRDKPVLIEGLVFRSAQRTGGRNVVLFGDAARVIDGTPSKPAAPALPDFDFDIPALVSRAADPPGLTFVADSFAIRTVTGASYEVSDETLPDTDPGL